MFHPEVSIWLAGTVTWPVRKRDSFRARAKYPTDHLKPASNLDFFYWWLIVPTIFDLRRKVYKYCSGGCRFSLRREKQFQVRAHFFRHPAMFIMHPSWSSRFSKLPLEEMCRNLCKTQWKELKGLRLFLSVSGAAAGQSSQDLHRWRRKPEIYILSHSKMFLKRTHM